MKVDTKIRVRYQETDQMQVVYYGNYFTWFEVGRNEFFRELNFPYKKLEEKGIFIPVVNANCDYKKPAYYDDIICITTCITNVSPAKVVLHYNLKRITPDREKEKFSTQQEENTEFIAQGDTTHAFVTETGPISLKKNLPSFYQMIEKCRVEER